MSLDVPVQQWAAERRLELWPAGRQGLLLLAILLLALGIRLSLWMLPVHQPANDEVEYLAVARDLLAGHGWRFYEHYPWLRAPLYPLFLAGSLALSGGDAQLASLPAIGLSVATVYLFFLLGQAVALDPAATSAAQTLANTRRATRVGLLAALLGACLLTLATFANLWMAETLWNFLFALALLLLLRWAGRPRLALAGWAGVLLGLATLTRSLPMLFVPAILVWMSFRPGAQPAGAQAEQRELRGALARLQLQPALFLLAFLLTLAPWTLRNWRAYHAFIPVETGLAYNLWAFNEPGLELDVIGETLSAMPNPGERAAYAQRRGLERLREDPAILLRRLWPNFITLLRVKPIEDRFIQQNYYSDVELPYFLAGLLADDLLYLLILLAAGWGLGAARPDRRLWLALLWLLYVLLTTALTHGEGRYRHFLFPLLIPYAAAGLTAGLRHGGRLQRFAGPAAACLLALLVLRSYPWGWAAQHTLRGGWQTLADWRAWRGDQQGALEAEQRAAQAGDGTGDAWIRVALAQQRLGQWEQAIQSYHVALTYRSNYYPASIRLGALLRALGRDAAARQAFQGQWVDADTVTAWAWANLPAAAPASLDVGDWLDTGFVTGVHAPEQYAAATARWTNGAAQLRLAGGPARLLLLRIAAPRPDGAPAPQLEVCLAQQCLPLPDTPGWRVYQLALPARQQEWLLTIRSTTFVPANAIAGATDTRRLGVLLDSVLTRPAD